MTSSWTHERVDLLCDINLWNSKEDVNVALPIGTEVCIISREDDHVIAEDHDNLVSFSFGCSRLQNQDLSSL